MQELDLLIDQIPIRHNLISSFVFAGLLMEFLIVIIIFARTTKNDQAIRLLGWLLLILGLIVLDNYLCYTGLIKYSLHLNDSTEILTLLIGPFVYFLTRAFVKQGGLRWKWDIIHFIVPVVYCCILLGYYISPVSTKYNAYVNAYHPNLEWYDMSYTDYFLFGDLIKSEFRILVLISFLIYMVLSVKVFLKYRRDDATNLNSNRIIFSKNMLLVSVSTVVIVFLVFLNYRNDLGDHLISIFLTITILIMTTYIMAESRFFEKSWIADKYETSGMGIAPEGVFLQIDKYVQDQSYFLNPKTSLSDLSAKLNIPNNYISQAINKAQGANFNDYINRYRVKEAQRRLSSEQYKHYNIESIGGSVGFNAKSTFYAAFKKHTGKTPSAYLKSL